MSTSKDLIPEQLLGNWITLIQGEEPGTHREALIVVRQSETTFTIATANGEQPESVQVDVTLIDDNGLGLRLPSKDLGVVLTMVSGCPVTGTLYFPLSNLDVLQVMTVRKFAGLWDKNNPSSHDLGWLRFWVFIHDDLDIKPTDVIELTEEQRQVALGE